jgi:hypothetical protein
VSTFFGFCPNRLRDPLKRAYSAFIHNCAKGRIPNYCAKGTRGKTPPRLISPDECIPVAFDCMVNHTLKRLNGGQRSRENCAGSSCTVLLSGLYYETIRAYVRPGRFAASQLLVVVSESLVVNTTVQMERVLQHIFVNPATVARARPNVWDQAYTNEAGFTVLPNTPSKSNGASGIHGEMLPWTATRLLKFYTESNKHLRRMFPDVSFPEDAYL